MKRNVSPKCRLGGTEISIAEKREQKEEERKFEFVICELRFVICELRIGFVICDCLFPIGIGFVEKNRKDLQSEWDSPSLWSLVSFSRL